MACFNTNLFSLHYEPWHIWNPDVFIIRGIFRALEYAKVRRYVHVSTFNVFFHLFLIYSRGSRTVTPKENCPPSTIKLTLTLMGGIFLGGNCPDTTQRMEINIVPSHLMFNIFPPRSSMLPHRNV